jgi:hypothetical protein
MDISRRDFLGLGLVGGFSLAGKLAYGSVNKIAPILDLTDEFYVERTGKEIGLEYSERELEIMAAVMFAEAGNQNYITQMLVGEVVRNRVEHVKYHDSIEGVVVDSGQFDGAKGTLNWRMAMGEVEMGNVVDERAYASCLKGARGVLDGTGIGLPNNKIIAFRDKSVSYEKLCTREVDGFYWRGLDFSFDSGSLSFYKDRVA